MAKQNYWKTTQNKIGKWTTIAGDTSTLLDDIENLTWLQFNSKYSEKYGANSNAKMESQLGTLRRIRNELRNNNSAMFPSFSNAYQMRVRRKIQLDDSAIPVAPPPINPWSKIYQIIPPAFFNENLILKGKFFTNLQIAGYYAQIGKTVEEVYEDLTIGGLDINLYLIIDFLANYFQSVIYDKTFSVQTLQFAFNISLGTKFFRTPFRSDFSELVAILGKFNKNKEFYSDNQDIVNYICPLVCLRSNNHQQEYGNRMGLRIEYK